MEAVEVIPVEIAVAVGALAPRNWMRAGPQRLDANGARPVGIRDL